MNKENQILNYFVTRQTKDSKSLVHKAPITVDCNTAYELLCKQLKSKNLPLPQKPLLHVCFDFSSKVIYTPNSNLFTTDEVNDLLNIAKQRISKEYGESGGLIIEGSPYSLLRVRSIDTFQYSYEYIKKQYNEIDSLCNNIPVIEANLWRMSKTLNYLPEKYRDFKYVSGGYIGTDVCDSVKFIEDKDVNGKNKQPHIIFEQKTPFILINLANTQIDYTEKEQIVISGIYDHLLGVSSANENKDLLHMASLFAQVKHFLYEGYPFEEICSVILDVSKNLSQFLTYGCQLLKVCKLLEKDGYSNPSTNPYYITCKINPSTFAIDIDSLITDGCIDSSKQIKFFKIIEFDRDNSFVIIETPLFMTQEVYQKILRSESTPIIVRNNPTIKAINVKTNGNVFSEFKRKYPVQLAKIKSIIGEDVEFRSDDFSRGVCICNSNVFNIRKISEYYHATDSIKEMCEDWNKNNNTNVQFNDIDVLVGPIERIFGRGVQGGFMDEDLFKENKMKIPYEIVRGTFISPPFISINSDSQPSYAQQISTLIHEYSHNLYSITHLNEEIPEYIKQSKLKETDEKKWYYLYFNDTNERLAHKYQIKNLLKSGLTPDEIIRHEVSGVITIGNYAIAMMYKELVDEAIKEIEN